MKKRAGPDGQPAREDPSRASIPDRRTALRRLLTGGALAGAAAALPATWTRPVVQSVLLPAHAQLSGETDGDFFLSFVPFRDIAQSSSGGVKTAARSGWLESLIPSAHAGIVISDDCVICNICARFRGGQVTVTANLTPPVENTVAVCYEGTGGIGDTVSLSVVSDEALECDPPLVTIVSLAGQAPERTLTVDDGVNEFSLVEDASRTCNCSELDGCVIFGDNCLLHGMPVLLPDGRSRSIETLSVGDAVAAVDHESGGIKPAFVTKLVRNHMRDHYWRINDTLLITNDHPVLVVEEAGPAWRRVDALAVGMAIQGVDGRAVITSLERVDEHVPTVYMETTADNFIAAPAGVEYVVKAGYGAAAARNRSEEGLLVSV